MKLRALPVLIFLAVLVLPQAALSSREAASAAPNISHSPFIIIENAGQWDHAARFQVWGEQAGTIWLAEDAIWVTVVEGQDQEAGRPGDQGAASHQDQFRDERGEPAVGRGVHVKLSFAGANPQGRMEAFNRLDTAVSYFIGSDPDQWHPAVPVWGGVRYVDLYPGIDLVMGGPDRAWQWEAAPGAAVGQVRVQVEGANLVSLDGATLQLEAAGFRLSFALPTAPFPYQISGVSDDGDVLALPVQPSALPLSSARPDDNSPDLVYSTFVGGAGADNCWWGVHVDDTGSTYLAGWTTSSNFPTTPGAFSIGYNGGLSDVFVVKLNPDGSSLAYATYLGGSLNEVGYDLAVDETGSAHISGMTRSSDFPTTPGAFSTAFNGGFSDAFVSKLDPAGSQLVYATYLGGNGEDTARNIVVTTGGQVYLAGSTASSDFPTTPGVLDPTYNGPDPFVAQLSPDASQLVYATFLGGSGDDTIRGMEVDDLGSAYVSGSTRSADFPTTPGAFDPSFNGGDCDLFPCYDAFVAKLTPDASDLAYSTFLGGSSNEGAWSLALDAAGNAYAAGDTSSADFPATPGAFDPTHNGESDAFLAKLDATGSALVYATFLGGSGTDGARGLALDQAGNAYVSGVTYASDFPATPGAFDTGYNGGRDAFVARLNPAGSEIDYASFLGAAGEDFNQALAVDDSGSAYVAGYTNSTGFPTTPGAFDTGYNGGDYDLFVSKLAMVELLPCCDFDGDGTVDVDDLAILAGFWGQPAAPPYDQDGDGWITVIDILRVARWWGWAVP